MDQRSYAIAGAIPKYRSNRAQVMLADRDHGTGLGPLVAFSLVQGIANFIADRERIELAFDHGVSVHVDLEPVARSDETVVAKELRDTAM